MHKPLRTVLSYVRKEDLPSNWTLVSVGDLLHGTQYGMNCPSVPGGANAIVGMKDIQDGRVLSRGLAKTNVSEAEIQSYRLRRGDLLLNRTNSLDQVGKVGLVETDRDDVFASYLVRLHVNTALVEPEYLNYWLNSSLAQRTIKRIATPAIGQANVNPTEFQKYCLVPLPPPSQRPRIVEILLSYDDAISKLKKLVFAKDQQLAYLSDNLLFGIRRIIAAQTDEFKKYRWFSVPSDWDAPRISEIASQAVRGTRDSDSIPVLSCTKYDGLVESLKYFGRQTFSEDTSSYRLVLRGQFAYATNHLEEGSIGYLDFLDRGLVSPMYTVFATDQSRVNDRFLFKLFKTRLYLHVFRANTSASVDRRGGLRWDDFAKIRVPLPKLEEQGRIDAILSAAQSEIDLLRKEMRLLGLQKRSLTTKLLTGECRVPVRDGDVEAIAARVAAEAAQ